MSETNNDSQPAPRLIELTTRYGRLAVPDADGDLIGRFLTRYGEWAWLEAAFAASVISDGARILDVGAFVGTFGLGVAQMRSLGSLYFVEANAAVAPLLQSNIADKIPCPMAVVQALVTGAEAGAKNRRYDPGNLGSMSFAAADDSAAPGAVRALTLADLRAQYGSFDLIKLDVEGMELEALRGDADFLSKGHTTLWIEANEDPRTLDVARLLLSWNLELFYFAFPAFNPRNFNGDSEAIFSFCVRGWPAGCPEGRSFTVAGT
jgi:FkbM family methyltransferase